MLLCWFSVENSTMSLCNSVSMESISKTVKDFPSDRHRLALISGLYSILDEFVWAAMKDTEFSECRR